MKVYVDSDVILDVLLARDEFVAESEQILNLSEKKVVNGCTTVLAMANIYYILHRHDKSNSRVAITTLRQILTVLPISDDDLSKALISKFKDLEDGIQYYAAERNRCDILITRNKKDFVNSLLPVLSPAEYLINPEVASLNSLS